jgi:hypothetical protein
MAMKQAVPGMGEAAIRRARDRLLELGFIERVHVGGRGKRDPSLYGLGRQPGS